MRTQLIRTATKRLDTLHASTYFSPIMSTSYEHVGLPRSAQYFAGRSCPLGAASAELVSAVFFNFNPTLVGKIVPACWDSVSPAQIHQARLAGVRKLMLALIESIGTRDQASAVLAAAVRLHSSLTPVIEAQALSGRALYAAHRSAMANEFSQDNSEEPLFTLWVTITLLREYRGDGHIATLVAEGLSGLEASVLDCATGRAWRPSTARRSRGWAEEEWRAAASDLTSRGLLSDESDLATLTEAGQELKESIETATDLTVAGAWSRIDDEVLSTVREDAKLIAETVASADLIPTKLFGRDQS